MLRSAAALCCASDWLHRRRSGGRRKTRKWILYRLDIDACHCLEVHDEGTVYTQPRAVQQLTISVRNMVLLKVAGGPTEDHGA
ncbi:hypothetical protein BAUCODRAFT_37958 [Baudoinia panamericana UAMH 10762]|uniref:Uncharacterized protein n=1 Tax=Baudoinia panamericana (strain UAMH 10762) TaxID=717646 RepID=M2M9G8_BAUPA|nr:uncharacterized protein BAUCODRAFT_37958 [Baudoinia panamericana UAMH 10762]EMC93036.1 hypothetical protein BAUCODRAFT_37958 [Baudoinia panamericana UAMH 10762]